ncbi:hypothetical protein WR25_26905 isoform D [Diploscapter pachys]|uniref:SXP/RAL-2 family protein Ani s 5-like cation-binding domain-containing protein n=1 Tax=Diploscapter pachys TaxID=2018661 RepID=A0A2A2JIG6_9BILA|nr:hypothetical protein WR25_26905 isoform D [Diploscapter pachys]
MKLWILAFFVGLSWAAPMAIESSADTPGIDPNPVEELPQQPNNSLKKTSDEKPAAAEMAPGDDDERDQFQIDVEAACGVNTGAIQPEQIEPLIVAFETLWKDVSNTTGLTPEEYALYINSILNDNNTKEERLAEVKEFIQTTVFDPETQEGGDTEAVALYNAAGILVDLTDFLRAGAADNEENPFAIIADLLVEMLIHLPEISPVNRENTRENVCAYMAEFIRQLKNNIHIELPPKETKVKGSGDKGKIAVKGSGSSNKEVPEITVGGEQRPGPSEEVPEITVGDEKGSESTKVEPKTITNNKADIVEEPFYEDDDMEEPGVPQNGTAMAQPPAKSPEVIHTGAVSDDGVMGFIEEMIADVFGDKAPEHQTPTNATKGDETLEHQTPTNGTKGDEALENYTHTNGTKQPEVSPALEGNVTETTTQEPGAMFIKISFNDEVSYPV